MANELWVAILVPAGFILGLLLGWLGHGRLSRSSTDVERDVLLRRAEADVTRLERETSSLREQLSAARAEKAGLEPQAARVSGLEARLEKVQEELVAANEDRGALQARAEQIPGLEDAVSRTQAEARDLRAVHAKALQEVSDLTARLEGERDGRSEALQSAETAKAELRGVRAQLNEAMEVRAGLQAKADMIPSLEQATRNEREEVNRLQREAAQLKSEQARLKTQLEESATRIEEQRQVLAALEAKFREAFQSLAAEALKSNNQAFLDLAKATMNEFQQGARADLDGRQKAIVQVVTPVREALEKFDAAVRGMENSRVEAYSSLKEQVTALKESQRELKTETSSLVKALRSPTTRGRWGEYQLRRVVELAGMVENCDFTEQAHVETEDGRLRPDVIVHLPGNKSTVIDAKVPLLAYLDAVGAQDEEARRGHLRDHARQLKTHITQLGSKAYWDQLPSSPDFVVMYVPMESAFAAALQEDPGLIDYAVECRVIPCGPMTLLTHLKAAAYGWRQERIAANAQQISNLGKELYNRLGTMADHFADVGKHLGKATESFNEAVGSLERRVLVSARRFRELGAANGEELPEVSLVGALPRGVVARELSAAAGGAGPLFAAAGELAEEEEAELQPA